VGQSVVANACGIDFLRPLFWPLVVGLAVTIIAVPIVRRVAVSIELYDRPDSGLKPHGRPIPYLGGVAMYVGWLAALHCAMLLVPGCRPAMPWIAVAGTVLMLTGLTDDIKRLRPGVRLLIQAGAAGFLLYGGIGRNVAVSLLDPLRGVLPAWMFADAVLTGLSGVFCIVVLIGASNSTNLIDGLDGLCAGILGLAALGFAAVAADLAGASPIAATGASIQALLAVAVLAACLGFLCYNFNPASIFMGDSGSLLLGLSVAVILIRFAEQPSWRWFAGALVVFGFPILDTTLAVARRWLNGRPLFVGDRSHFYDQVRDRGLSVRRTVLLCYLIGLCFAALGTALPHLPLAYLIAVLVALPIVFAVACRRLGMLRVDDAAERSRRA
jgi:UDP-GlcNAc:undecaprenyl-phosphate/decaprenyl-phosphate GlcNAc-1-phosphate transferase